MEMQLIDIEFDLSHNFPYSPPIVTSNLPININFEWDPQITDLLSIINRYENEIPFLSSIDILKMYKGQYQPYFMKFPKEKK